MKKLAKDDKATLKKLKDQLDLHQRRGDAFHSKRKEVVKSIKNDPTSVAICFDFQKNLPLPVTNVGPEYYKRQLWLHNFGIHDMKTRQGTMFMYSEHFAGKGPNEVISILDWYFSEKVPAAVKHVHLFADIAPLRIKTDIYGRTCNLWSTAAASTTSRFRTRCRAIASCHAIGTSL